MGFDNECVLTSESVPHEYFCVSCLALVYPNEALQAPCKHLLCAPCLTDVPSCPIDSSVLTDGNCKPLLELNERLAEMIGNVMVCCLNHKSGCQWQGLLSEYVAHGTICPFGSSHIISSSTRTIPIQAQGAAQLYNVLPSSKKLIDSRKAPLATVTTHEIPQDLSIEFPEEHASQIVEPQPSCQHDPTALVEDLRPIDRGSLAVESYPSEQGKFKNATADDTVTAKELSQKYVNAHFFWSWHEMVIEGRTILSHIKDHDNGMSLFFSTISALEANLRIKGSNVKELSPHELCEQYVHFEKELPFIGFSKLLKVAEILKIKGAVHLNPELKPGDISTMRFKILGYKVFNTKTVEGLSSSLDHLRMHGPLVGVYHVTEYQKRNKGSHGIIHGFEEVSTATSCEDAEDRNEATYPTNTICITGFGVEDSCSYFQFQKFSQIQDENKMFGRVLASSVLEMVGFFCREEAPIEYSSRQKTET